MRHIRSVLGSVLPWLSALAVWGGAAGCFQPSLPVGQFKCDRPEDTCPMGMQCVSGLCQSRQDDPGAPAAIDMATPTPIPTTRGCSGTGKLLASSGGKDAYACSGSFPTPSSAPTALCGGGYHVCRVSDRALFADARAQGRCDSATLGGFFATDVPAGYDGNGTAVCEPKTALPTAALVGCGPSTGTRSLDPPCLDLVIAAPCNGSVDGWSCTSGLVNASHAAGKGGGVLCCQD